MMTDAILCLDIPESYSLCDEGIKIFEEIKQNKKTQTRKDEFAGTLQLEKKDEFCFLEDSEVEMNFSKNVMDILWNIGYKQYSDYYGVLETIARHVNETSIKIQKTLPGGGYHIWHCESDGNCRIPRVLAWILYLNDVEHGGETEFLYQHRRVEARKGRLVIFPAYFTHTHRGNPPLSGEKYIATGWIRFETDN